MTDNSEVTTYDLTREVPSGITLSGLSEPKFDGVNYFRQPHGHNSTISFNTDKVSFVQLEYQLFSRKSNILVSVKLDGKNLNTDTFPAGKFISNAAHGDFVEKGNHIIEFDYDCRPSCLQLPSQYWTKLTLINKNIPEAVQVVGLNTVQLNQYALQPLITLKGVGQLHFDGVNFFRSTEKNTIEFDWPQNIKVLNVNLQFLGNQPFKVTAGNGSEVLVSATGNSKKDVFLHVNLINKNTYKHLILDIKCLSTPNTTCTNLYFPNIIGRQKSPEWLTSIPLSIIIILLIMFALRYLLFPKYFQRLFPHRPTTTQQNAG